MQHLGMVRGRFVPRLADGLSLIYRPGLRQQQSQTVNQGTGRAKATTASPESVPIEACPPAAMTTNCLPVLDEM